MLLLKSCQHIHFLTMCMHRFLMCVDNLLKQLLLLYILDLVIVSLIAYARFSFLSSNSMHVSHQSRFLHVPFTPLFVSFLLSIFGFHLFLIEEVLPYFAAVK